MCVAIIAAAGKGTRMGKGKNKAFLKIGENPILHHTLLTFEKSPDIDKVIVVAGREDLNDAKLVTMQFSKVRSVIAGGKERQDSVHAGLAEAEKFAGDDEIIVIHNGSNPFVSHEEIAAVIKEASAHGAAACAFPAKDTLREVREGYAHSTINRDDIWCMQTPQAMKLAVAKAAFSKAREKKIYATDDIALFELLGKKARIVRCSYRNFKITTQDDLEIADALLRKKNREKTVVGIGHDSHRFGTSGTLVLGGVEFKEPALKAWSDGDVVLHALFNAISSALGRRSIGHYFPDNSEENRGRKSSEFFSIIHEMLSEEELRVNNVSITIEGKRPRIEPKNDMMRESIASILRTEKENVGIAATTGEGLTPFGTGRGIQCYARVSLIENK